MKKVLTFAIVFLLFLISTSCDKNRNRIFSGLIVTDIYGQTQGIDGDEDGDWQFNDRFNKTVTELFQEEFVREHMALSDTSFRKPSEGSMGSLQISAFPNPAVESIQLFIGHDFEASANVKLALVNEDYKSFLNYELDLPPGSVIFSINLVELGINRDILYRIYYIIEDITSGDKHYGHGDILLKD